MTSPENRYPLSRIRNSKGFTLIEMAIVLVIIGIIVGAIVKGGDLISNANDKKIKGEIDTIRAAFNTYYDKKGVVPTAMGSLVAGSIGVDAPTVSATNASITYTIPAAGALGGGSLYITGLTSEQITNYDTKYDNGTLTTGDVTGTTTYMIVRLK
jgi:prepilin-type N-terminal cleavage/methylation domain-containing protein